LETLRSLKTEINMSHWPGKSRPDELPPSLNPESFELRDSKDHYYDHPEPSHDTAGNITPYLGLRARLSQIWINRWTVLLLLVLVRVLILITTLNDDIGSAKVKALSACTKVEDIGSAMASMPHYLSVGVNKLAGTGISKAVHAMATILDMILTGVENLIFFVVNFYVGMYVCLTGALVHGTLDIGIGSAKAVTDVMNKGIKTVTDELADDSKKIQDEINKVIDLAKNIPMFGKDINVPTIDIAGKLDSLRNIKVDTGEFVKTLSDIKDDIPTYDDVEKAAKEALAVPFDLVKQKLNETYGSYKFDTSVFPVAAKEKLNFCSSNTKIRDFFDGLYTIARNAKITFTVILLLLAILACVPMFFLEKVRYSRQKSHSRLFRRGYDAMDVVYMASRSTSARIGIWLARPYSRRDKQKNAMLVRWAWAYATSAPALFVLSLALAGFFSCFCQWILLRVIQKEAPALANQVGDFAGEVVQTLEGVSQKWANDSNAVILGFQSDINDDLLGHVVKATSAVNDTLNTFTTEINKAIDLAFGKTILDKTVKDIVRCIIGLKVEAVEKGLTWVHDNARVTLPLFDEDVFSVGAQKSISGDSELTTFLASPSSVTTDEITDAIEHVINFLHNNIVQEALISTGLVLVYVIVVLIGVLRMAGGLAAPDRTRAEGGQRFGPPPPLSPTRSMSEASVVRYAGDLKEKPQQVRVGKGVYQGGHIRGSSYGHVEDTRV